ncbi:serum response factor-binding protein 1 [Discoglossus pictus]
MAAPVLNLNNEVVKMRKDVKKVKVLTIRKLTRHIAKLKSKKGTEELVLKNQRRAQRLLEEIHAIKEVKPDDVTKTALQKDINFEKVCKKPSSTPENRAIARLATHPLLKKKIEAIKDAVKAFKEARKNLPEEEDETKQSSRPLELARSVDKAPQSSNQSEPEPNVDKAKQIIKPPEPAQNMNKSKQIRKLPEPAQNVDKTNQTSKLPEPAQNVDKTKQTSKLPEPAQNVDKTKQTSKLPEPAQNVDKTKQTSKLSEPAQNVKQTSKPIEPAQNMGKSKQSGKQPKAAQNVSSKVQNKLKLANAKVVEDCKVEENSLEKEGLKEHNRNKLLEESALTTENQCDKTESPCTPQNLQVQASEYNTEVKVDGVESIPENKAPLVHELNSNSSDIEDSDKEEKEYFDDSTEERFYKQSSGFDDSDSDSEDDFFIGKVKRTKKKKSDHSSGEKEKKVQPSKDAPKKADAEMQKVGSIDKAVKLKSLFCSSLSEPKPNPFNKKRDTKFPTVKNTKTAVPKPRAFDRKPLPYKETVQRKQNDTQDKPLHPSWEASRKRKEQLSQITAYQGKKIIFED